MYQLTKRNHQCRTSSVRNKIKWNFIYCVLLFFSLGNQKRTNPLFRWCKNVTYCNQLQINSENITISSSNQEITPFPYLTNTNLLWSDSYGYSYYCSIIRKKDSASISDIWYSILSFSFSFFFFLIPFPVAYKNIRETRILILIVSWHMSQKLFVLHGMISM